MASIYMRPLYFRRPVMRVIRVLISPCKRSRRTTMNVTTTRHFKEAGSDGTFRMIFRVLNLIAASAAWRVNQVSGEIVTGVRALSCQAFVRTFTTVFIELATCSALRLPSLATTLKRRWYGARTGNSAGFAYSVASWLGNNMLRPQNVFQGMAGATFTFCGCA